MSRLITVAGLSSRISGTDEKTFSSFIVYLSTYFFRFRELSEIEVEAIIDRMRNLLSKLQNSESDLQLVNILQEMDQLNVSLDVLRVTGAGRTVEDRMKHEGEAGQLATLLVNKWKKLVLHEQQRRIETVQKELPDDLSEADVEINSTVTAFKYGSSGYETLSKLGVAIIHPEDMDYYQLLLFRPKQCIVTIVKITDMFFFLVHQNNFISFVDEENTRWRIRFKYQDDLNDFARVLLLLKAQHGKEEVVSTDLVIGEGSVAELGDSLEVQMGVWEVDGKDLIKMIENTHWNEKCIKFKLGGKNRFFSLKKNIVGMKKGGRRFLIASTINGRTAYDIEIVNMKAVNTSNSISSVTKRNEPPAAGRDECPATTDDASATAEDDANEHTAAPGSVADNLDAVVEVDTAIADDAVNDAATSTGRTEYAATTDDANATAEDDANEHAAAPGSVEDDPDVVVEADTTVSRGPSGNKKPTSREKKAEEIAAKNANVQEALAAFKNGVYKSRRRCAEAFGIPETTLRRASNTEDFVFKGKGRKSEVMTEEEEKKVKDHIVQRLKLGVGLDLYQVQDLIQELLMGVVDANPERYVPWGDNPDSPYRPSECWVRRFLKRHNLKYRSSMHINNARAHVTREEVELWFEDVRQILSDPELAEAMADPSRVFNWVRVSTFIVCSCCLNDILF